ncbi:hypothetical protein [Mycolicibacterium gilvum]|uniref:Uncharacterized protein n=1 Tax=Mycolicibacterium gilvum (strain DSM 45189 / LMG 24558 / Spyr1) TaxID=278137 RepID=E6TGZ9_MYCSR|nr:hypothetical protein [Mycolicibacterium gilvum]ADT97879.1 hypothetical protein Mspyr1_11970 [Mycolicibacterium gilvum Spyr1]
MSRRRNPADEVAPLPVADMPTRLQVYDPADWLPPAGVAEPVDGHDEAAWDAFEVAERRAYEAFQAAGREWHTRFQLPPLNIAELPPDEPFTPPPNKVDDRTLPGPVDERLGDEDLGGERRGRLPGLRSSTRRRH